MIKDDKRKFFTAGELANIFNVSKQSLLFTRRRPNAAGNILKRT